LGERTSESHTPHLAAAQMKRRPVRELARRQSDVRERRIDARRHLGAIDTRFAQPVSDVVRQRLSEKLSLGELEDEARGSTLPSHRPFDAAALRQENPGEHMQQRRLPRAGGAEKPDAIARVQLEHRAPARASRVPSRKRTRHSKAGLSGMRFHSCMRPGIPAWLVVSRMASDAEATAMT
jgi:hypothetical protein